MSKRVRQWFEPQVVAVPPARLQVASLLAPDVALADHDGEVATATYGSLLRYRQRFGMVDASMVLEP